MKALIVGYGNIGKRHYHNLINMKIPVHTTKTNDLKKSLIKYKPDVVFICNATSQHISSAIKVAQYGAHLFIEKPLSHSLHGTKRLNDLIIKKKIICMIGYNLRFHPSIINAKKIIESGTLGKIIYVHAEVGSYFPHWHTEQDYSLDFRTKKQYGGGVILDMTHEINYIDWLLNNTINQIHCFSKKANHLKMETENLADIFIKARSITGLIHLDYLQQPGSRYFKIIGENGTIYYDLSVSNELYIKEIQHFLNCIRKRKKPINNYKESLRTLKIALAAKRSAENGGKNENIRDT